MNTRARLLCLRVWCPLYIPPQHLSLTYSPGSSPSAQHPSSHVKPPSSHFSSSSSQVYSSNLAARPSACQHTFARTRHSQPRSGPPLRRLVGNELLSATPAGLVRAQKTKTVWWPVLMLAARQQSRECLPFATRRVYTGHGWSLVARTSRQPLRWASSCTELARARVCTHKQGQHTDRGHSLHLRCCHTRSSCRPSHRCQHTTPAPLSQWVCLLGHQIQPCAPPEPTVRGPSTPCRAHSAAGTSSCARIGRRSPRRAARSPLSPPPLRTAATPAPWLEVRSQGSRCQLVPFMEAPESRLPNVKLNVSLVRLKQT